MQTRGRIFGALAVLVAVVIGLHVLGSASGLTLADWRSWTEESADAATGVIRLLALALAYYLIMVLVAVLFLSERIDGHWLEKFIPYGMFVTLGLVAGVGALTVASSSGQVSATGPTPLTLQPSAAPLTLQPATDMGIAPGADMAANYPPFGTDYRATTATGDTWKVRNGESFWSIAEEALQDAWGVDELTDEEIVSYWEPLIEANQDRLVDPGNPDLILPDQELVLPPTPER